MIRGALALALGAGTAGADTLPWSPEPPDQCLRPGLAPTTPDQTRLAASLARIEAIAPGLDPLVALWDGGDIPLCLESRPFEALAYFAPDRPLLVLDARLSDGALAAVLVHELRHVQQHASGLCPTLALRRADYERLTFALEADALAIATLYASRARAAGDPGPWEGLTTLLPHSADIASAFDAALRSGATESESTARAFATWEQDEDRVTAYHLATCSAYYDALDEGHLLPGTEVVTSEMLKDICRMPEGDEYDCANEEQVERW